MTGDEKYQEWLDNLKVGDEVAIHWMNEYWKILKVERRTKTLIVCNNLKFNNKGKINIGFIQLYQITDKIRELAKLTEHRFRIIEKIEIFSENFEFEKFSIEDLNKIDEVLNEYEERIKNA